eukprot:CCRYP_011024-RA/>CCRYP_011024-RA protein AED:0.43 eAED:0.44 QI:0/0/0/1/0/0/3/0/118
MFFFGAAIFGYTVETRCGTVQFVPLWTVGEFKKVKLRLINIIEVNKTSRNEHGPEIERKIRHIKERTWSIKADLSFSIRPGQLIKRMVLHAFLFMNSYTDKQGISDEYYPRELILRLE